MNAQPLLTRLKRQLKRATSLLMLFQRGGATAQALVPELNLAASAGALEAAKAVVATAVGLGAYDSVAGATSVVQTAPRQDSKLVFVVGSSTSAGLAISGTSHGAPTWTMSPSVSGLTLWNRHCPDKNGSDHHGEGRRALFHQRVVHGDCRRKAQHQCPASVAKHRIGRDRKTERHGQRCRRREVQMV